MEFSSAESLQGASLQDNGLRTEKRFLPDKTVFCSVLIFLRKYPALSRDVDIFKRAQSPLRLLNAVVCRQPNLV